MAKQTLLDAAGADETGTAVTIKGRKHIVSVSGTFSGAAVHLMNSLHGNTFVAVNDSSGSPVVITEAINDIRLSPFLEEGYQLRADTVGGDGSTAIDAFVETSIENIR